jgi:predicted acylesterase/phospholipase RssA
MLLSLCDERRVATPEVHGLRKYPRRSFGTGGAQRRVTGLFVGALALLSLGLASCSTILQIPKLWVKPITTPEGTANLPACEKFADVVEDNPDNPGLIRTITPDGVTHDSALAVGGGAPEDYPKALRELLQVTEPAAGGAALSRPAGAGPTGEVVPARPIDLNLLIMSGGAQWGAYGSGFLYGLYESAQSADDDRASHEVPLGEYNVITGISTGALMIPNVWTAVVQARAHDYDAARATLFELKSLYDHNDADLFTPKDPLLYTVWSNGVVDPSRGTAGPGSGLQPLVAKTLHEKWPVLASAIQSGPAIDAEAGAANVLDGKFYSFHLGDMIASTNPSADPALRTRMERCTTEVLLASAAIPLGFPPRFIDGEPYVDGGVRYLAYVGSIIDAAGRIGGDPGRPSVNGYYIRSLNVRVIVNGNQSVNDPGTSAAGAKACDAERAPRPAGGTKCPPVSTTLLGSFVGDKGKGLVLRVTQDLMIHQIKTDSVSRIYDRWRLARLPGTFKYTYISNTRLSGNLEPGTPCEKTQNGGSFDRHFEECLFTLGEKTGQGHRWIQLPALAPAIPPVAPPRP